MKDVDDFTVTQALLLIQICEQPSYVEPSNRSAAKLIKRGLAEFRGKILHPTQEGLDVQEYVKQRMRNP